MLKVVSLAQRLTCCRISDSVNEIVCIFRADITIFTTFVDVCRSLLYYRIIIEVIQEDGVLGSLRIKQIADSFPIHGRQYRQRYYEKVGDIEVKVTGLKL